LFSSARSELGIFAQGGDISLHAGKDIITAAINSTGQSGSGDITITTNENVSFEQLEFDSTTRNLIRSDRGVVITSDTFGAGRGGNIQIAAQSISLTNGSQLSASTHSSGRGGAISLNADVIELSGISPNNRPPTNHLAGSSFSIEVGIAGIPEGTYLGGYIPTGTTEDTFSGVRLYNAEYPSGMFTQTTRGSTGNAGNIRIEANQLTVREGAAIAATTFGQGNAGNILVQSDRIGLDHGSIQSGAARQSASHGGNITLQVDNLLSLRHGSRIFTDAGNDQRGGHGGNIRIDAGTIFATPLENNDITANAFAGTGGRIDIEASGIVGMEPRDQPTAHSDITASSARGISGSIQLNSPDVDPSQGTTELPTEVTDASQAIVQTCPTGGEVATEVGEFTVTGRGGIPANPADVLGGEVVLTHLATLEGGEKQGSEGAAEPGRRGTAETEAPPASLSPPSSPPVEAQGWLTSPTGEVILVAAVPTAEPHSSTVSEVPCNGA
jgi:large exoprotein involved in heme utilization and adhesion